jgi:hypothetical protein
MIVFKLFVVEFSLQSHKPMGTWMNDSFSLQDIFTSTMSRSSLFPYFPFKFHFDKMCQYQQQISPQSSLSWGFLSSFHSIMDASQRCHIDCTQLSIILALLISPNRNFDQVSNFELSLSCCLLHLQSMFFSIFQKCWHSQISCLRAWWYHCSWVVTAREINWTKSWDLKHVLMESSTLCLESILYSIERVSESYQLRPASKFGFQGNSVPLSSKLSTELMNWRRWNRVNLPDWTHDSSPYGLVW